MKKSYGVNELRRKYLEFFESKDHLAMKSFSLVPHNDNSLLLINAGMVLRDAWSMIAESSDTALGREMKQTSSDIRNGMPETDAFNLFAERCRTKEIRKFAGSLVQNIKKGSAGLSESLQQLADEQWDEKKNYVRKKAASSEQKLLFPMLMIFVSIIMMIVVPVFTNML